MEKITLSDDLAKAFKGLVGHFKKAAAHHKALSEHHDGIAKVHDGHHVFHKASSDACDDGDHMKAVHADHAAFHKAKAEFHKGAASLHKAHAEHLGELADAYDVSDKAAGASGPGAAAASAATLAGKGENAGELAKSGELADFMKGVISDAFGDLAKTADFKDAVKGMIREFAIKQTQAALENTAAPLVGRSVPAEASEELRKKDLTLVPRAGAPSFEDESTIEAETEDMDPMLRKAVVGED